MAEWEDPERPSFHECTKIITIYRAIIDKQGQKTNRKDFLKLKI